MKKTNHRQKEKFVKHIPDKRFTSRIYKNAQNSTARKQINQFFFSGQKYLNRHFTIKHIWMANKHKRCSRKKHMFNISGHYGNGK